MHNYYNFISEYFDTQILIIKVNSLESNKYEV